MCYRKHTYNITGNLLLVTKDKYQDLILCAISSVVPIKSGQFETALLRDAINQLSAPSIIKVDKIATLKKENIITTLGTISSTQKSYL